LFVNLTIIRFHDAASVVYQALGGGSGGGSGSGGGGSGGNAGSLTGAAARAAAGGTGITSGALAHPPLKAGPGRNISSTMTNRRKL